MNKETGMTLDQLRKAAKKYRASFPEFEPKINPKDPQIILHRTIGQLVDLAWKLHETYGGCQKIKVCAKYKPRRWIEGGKSCFDRFGTLDEREKCTCGADEHNEKLVALLSRILELSQPRDLVNKEPQNTIDDIMKNHLYFQKHEMAHFSDLIKTIAEKLRHKPSKKHPRKEQNPQE